MLKTFSQICAGVAAVAVLKARMPAAEPAAGAALEVPIQESGQPQIVVFRYCPPGKLRPGKPQAGGQDDAPAAAGAFALPGDGTVDMRAFYISEAEITIPQFKEVVDGKTFADLLKRVEKLTGKPELIAAVKSAQGLPVFAVTAEEGTRFCKRLTERLLASGGDSGLEMRRCRLPSHHEWQYACRARTDPKALPPLPRFNRWPDSDDVLDKAIRQMCDDEWKDMGKTEAFRGTQEQVAEILQRQSTKNSKPLEILSAFLQAGLGVQRNFAVNRPGELHAPRATPANAWNIYDMHENLREWVIAENDLGPLYPFWERLTDESIDAGSRQKKLFFLAGGSFGDFMWGTPGAWEKFTIWGGYPLDLAGGTPLPFSLDEAASDVVAAGGVAFDQAPGLRVVLERILRSDWLLVIRRLAVQAELAQLRQQNPFDRYRAQVSDLVPAALQPKVSAQIAFYESLAAYRGGDREAARKKLAEAKPGLVPGKKAPNVADLADLVGGSSGPPSGESEKPSEDAVFLNQLEQLLAADAGARPPAR